MVLGLMQVWVLSEASHDDSEVTGVFTSREAASHSAGLTDESAGWTDVGGKRFENYQSGRNPLWYIIELFELQD